MTVESAQRKTTSFADATRVTPVPGTDNQFEATIHWDWCGGLSVHEFSYVTAIKQQRK